jgi:hypothetical protein
VNYETRESPFQTTNQKHLSFSGALKKITQLSISQA